MQKPESCEDMEDYIIGLGITEATNFHKIMVENGWASDEDDAKSYLESLGVFPWDD
jgi:hypothetical protein